MSGSIFPWSSSLEPLASYAVSRNVSLHILAGSVADYAPGAFRATSQDNTHGESTKKQRLIAPILAAIVNAANEGCLGGGGVDGAISQRGGINLAKDRQALPLLPNPSGGPDVRCPTGRAVATGPGDYGRLQVPYVIHAVGPIYNQWRDLAEPNALLQSAYTTSLQVAQANGISEVAFALLSAGVFRGQQTLEEVLSIAIRGVQDFVQQNDEGETVIEEISLVAFSSREQKVLLEVATKLLSPSEESQSEESQTEDSEMASTATNSPSEASEKATYIPAANSPSSEPDEASTGTSGDSEKESAIENGKEL
ncbi:unnamed protein product [Cylindrotheca closterium]|uniref:Macro domain-containing protein n=1 Tax=Cylindrotheca closterium TaxID=2856 RepID=A0AAD2FG14_9STRA|nr:unnamed protein product [Cylindrotheca closterium]